MTDQTRMSDQTLSEFTAQLASAQPAPGGGGAAALAGALAASLAAMAANVTAANPRYADRTDALTTLAAACDAQRRALLALIDADAAGFLPLQRPTPFRKPTLTVPPGSRPRRARRVRPRWPCWSTARRRRCCCRRARDGQPPSCARISGARAALCRAAAEAAAMNVLVNTGLLAPDDRTEIETHAEHLRATVAQSCAQTVDAVRAALRGEG